MWKHVAISVDSGLLLSGLPTKSLYAILHSLICSTSLTSLIVLDYIILIILTEADCEDISIFLLLPPLKAEICPSVLSVVLSTFNECSFITLGDEALHSSNTTAKIMVLCILIFTF
jgi:hypothetical protein